MGETLILHRTTNVRRKDVDSVLNCLFGKFISKWLVDRGSTEWNINVPQSYLEASHGGERKMVGGERQTERRYRDRGMRDRERDREGVGTEGQKTEAEGFAQPPTPTPEPVCSSGSGTLARRGEVATSVSMMLLKALPRDQTGTSKLPTDLAFLFGELPSMLFSITHPSLPYVLHCPSRLCSSFHFPSCNQNKGKPLAPRLEDVLFGFPVSSL